jgi:branched-chain amino acid transport system substrate-binding protein
VWAIPPGAGIVATNVKASGFSGPVYFDPGAGAELFIRGAGKAAEGALLVHPAVLVADQIQDAANKKEMDEFHTAYTDAYGEYSGFASYAADALGMLVAAIKASGKAESQAIRDSLETLKYTGVTGVYSMSKDDHSALDPSALVLVTVKDGKWQLVKG